MEAKIKNLVDSISSKTRNKQAIWERIGNSEQFSLQLETGKVLLSILSTNDNNKVLYQLAIINLRGDRIFELNVKTPESYSYDPDFDSLKALYEDVKKAYYRVDETIEGMLGEVDKSGKIGKRDDLPF